MKKQDQQDKRWLLVDLPVTEYGEAWELQANLVNARKSGTIDRNIVLLLEHFPVFTIGRRSNFNDLTVSEDFLEKQGIHVIKIERGGNITFHGPGQIIMYPIIDLRLARLGVAKYIEKLEELMILAASDFGIKAERNSMNRGVWVGNKKVGSVGIAIRHGISFHGLALNVNLSLKPFYWINPCGLKNISMTSIEQELSHKISMDQARNSIKKHTATVFRIGLEELDLKEINEILEKTCCVNMNEKNEDTCLCS